MTEPLRARVLPAVAILLVGLPVLATAYEFILVALETYGDTCPDSVYLDLVSDRKVLLRRHPSQLQKVFKSPRPKSAKP